MGYGWSCCVSPRAKLRSALFHTCFIRVMTAIMPATLRPRALEALRAPLPQHRREAPQRARAVQASAVRPCGERGC